jgi:hypothetical protein
MPGSTVDVVMKVLVSVVILIAAPVCHSVEKLRCESEALGVWDGGPDYGLLAETMSSALQLSGRGKGEMAGGPAALSATQDCGRDARLVVRAGWR